MLKNEIKMVFMPVKTGIQAFLCHDWIPAFAGMTSIIIMIILCLVPCAFAQADFVYDAKGKRNPFIPLVTSDGQLIKLQEEEKKNELSLKGIIYDKSGSSFAIINDEVIKAGDELLGFKVVKIEERKIILTKDGVLQEMELPKEGP